MPNILIIIILAIVQGATEFLPISSSGHLVLLYKIFNIKNNTILLSVLLHLATLISVCIFYRKQIFNLIKKPFCKTNIAIIITTIVTCVMALLLKPNIKNSFDGKFLPICFILTAILLFVSQLIKNKQTKSIFITDMNISLKKAIVIGFAQGVACFPGISRSGTTIATGLLIKSNREDVTTYSFLISIPIILASTVLEVAEYVQSPQGMPFSVIELIVGFVVSLIVGILSIKLMTTFVKKQKLYYFSYYLLILSAVSSFLV